MSAATTTLESPNPEKFFAALNAYQQSFALKAAIDLDIFTTISAGTNRADETAAAVHASARGVRILCDYLVVTGFLQKERDRYSLSGELAMFLDEKSPAYLGSIAHFLLNPTLTAPFLGLTEVVRSGRTTLPDQGTVSRDNPVWVEFAKKMMPMMFPAADEIAAALASDREVRVLDIAAGHGLFGIMVAQSSPLARIVALDWPNVLAVAEENSQRFGVADRYSTLPGDAFEVDFDGRYDLVLVTNFFHHFDVPTCERLMRKIHTALVPGGRCVTLDFVPNDDRVTPPLPASFAMMMLGTTVSGDAYTFREYDAMFRSAGFVHSEHRPLQQAPQSIIISTRQ